jgi:hypothetical protein
VAGNPNTPVDVLRELSQNSDRKSFENVWVRRVLVENPNTPIDVLRELKTLQYPEI